MEKFVKGEIVVLPFPFTNLSGSKKRPAYVLSDTNDDHLILCQITSKYHFDDYSIEIKNDSFKVGSLFVELYIRTNRIFTADKKIILKRIGILNKKYVNLVQQKVIELIS